MHLQPFDHNKNGPKIGGSMPFFREASWDHHLAQRGLDQGPPPSQVPS